MGYEENEQVRRACRMYAALVHRLISKAEEVWLMIMENVPQKGKVTLFLDLSSNGWRNRTWNINKHRHRTNNAVEGWNSNLNSVIGRQQANVFLQVQKSKEEAQLVSWQLKSK